MPSSFRGFRLEHQSNELRIFPLKFPPFFSRPDHPEISFDIKLARFEYKREVEVVGELEMFDDGRGGVFRPKPHFVAKLLHDDSLAHVLQLR